MNKNEQIVITGIGPLTSAGNGIDNVWSAIERQDTGLVYKEYRIADEKVGSFYVHEICDFDIGTYGINQQILNEIKSWKMGDEILDLYYFLAVIKMAIDNSRLEITDKTKNKIGLLLAHENIGHDQFYWKIIHDLSFVNKNSTSKPVTKKDFLEYFYKKFQRTGYELQTFMSLHHIAKIFDIHGYSLIVNNACASGLYALEAAADAIKTKKCKQMIIAAVDHSSIFKHMWFKDINICARDGRIKPFALDRDGFTIGDGGAALVLESMDSAIKRGANIYAEYMGGSFVLEGWKVTYPDVANDFYSRVILNALSRSNMKPKDIDLLVPHGVGTNITDKYEAKAITDIFGKEANKPKITALKPYIGHTLGSTAILEIAIMLISLKKRKVPPTLNCEKLDTTLGIDLIRNMAYTSDIKIAMKTACGFAGFNAACVFKKSDKN